MQVCAGNLAEATPAPATPDQAAEATASPELLMASPKRGASDEEMGDEMPKDLELSTKRKKLTKKMAPPPACYLCEKPGDLVHTYFGEEFHSKCFLAVRSRRRIVSGTEEADKDQQDFTGHVSRWRANHMPFLLKRATAVRALKKKKTVGSKNPVTRKTKVKHNPKFNKRRCVSFTMLWDRVSEKEAEDMFDKRYAEDPQDNSDGEAAVTTKGMRFDNDEKGTATSKGEKTTSRIEADSDAGADSQSLPGDEDSDSDAPMATAPSTVASSAAQSHRSSQPPKQGRRIGALKRCAGTPKRVASPAGKETAASPAKGRKVAMPAELGSHAKFLVKKKWLHEKLEAAAEEHKGRRSVVKEIQKFLDRMNGNKHVPKNANAVLTRVQDASKKLTDMVSTLDETEEGDLTGIEQDIDRACKESKEALKAGAFLLQSLEMVNEKIVGDRRKAYMQDRHQHLKVAGRLQHYGKWPKDSAANLSKMIAANVKVVFGGKAEGDDIFPVLPTMLGEKVCEVPWDASTFDFTKICFWAEPPAPIAEMIKGSDIEKKVSMADDYMTNNPSWLGAQSKVDFVQKEYAGISLREGFGPHIVSLKRDVPRLGAAAMALPTVANFSTTLAEPMFMLMLEAKEILGQGISLVDIKAFLGTESGAKFLASDSAKLLFLPRQATVYMPFGWYAIPLYYTWKDQPKKSPTFTHALHVPVITDDLAQNANIDVMKAANVLISTHLEPLKASMWKERFAAWKALQERLTPKPSA